MQLNFFSGLRWCGFALMAALGLAACDRGAGTAQAAATSGGDALEVVLRERPDPVDGYLKVTRATYDSCVHAAEIMHRPVQPYPTPAADLGSKRVVYLLQGKNMVRHSEHLVAPNTSATTPDSGCKVSFDAQPPDAEIIQNGKHTLIGASPDGKVDVQTEDVTELLAQSKSGKSASAANYSEKRTIGGVELRCLPANSRMLNPQMLLDQCIAANEGVVDVYGEPIVLYARVKPVGADPRFPFLMITEPVSVRKLDRVDARQFNAESYTK